MLSANRCRYSRGLKRLVRGSARVLSVWRWCPAIANFSRAFNFKKKPISVARRNRHARRVRYLGGSVHQPRLHLLRAFFKSSGLTAEMREHFAGEMERAGNQNWIWFRPRQHQCVIDVWSEGVGEWGSNVG